MIKLDAGNVLLKPSHRKQLNSWLRRCQKLGQRLGDLVITISLSRIGKSCQIRARVHDRAGDFDCRTRNRDWRTAMRDLIRTLTARLHRQALGVAR